MTPEEKYLAMFDDVFKNGTGVMKIIHVDINAEFDQIGEAMNEVAQRFAHRLALDLECVLARYSGPWYDEAMQTLSDYRTAMNELHEKQAPTFMGEPLVRDDK